MINTDAIDRALVHWGERLFYPGIRIVPGASTPRRSALAGRAGSISERARFLRARIHAAVVRRAPQVMVKVTGGGRGMKAIAAHLRYISKHGRLEMEDEQGNVTRGEDAVRQLAEEWRYGGSLIPEESPRREAFNLMLSTPRGTDPLIVQRAAREFAREEFAEHNSVMVLHEHQANPHVHLSVRAESKHGRRLNPRKADLHRWRERFAQRLRAWGVGAEATRQSARGVARNYPQLWQVKAAADERLRNRQSDARTGTAATGARTDALEALRHIAAALNASGQGADRQLAAAVVEHIEQARRLSARQPGLCLGEAKRTDNLRGGIER
jgi:hypothetical protein